MMPSTENLTHTGTLTNIDLEADEKFANYAYICCLKKVNIDMMG